ncbi:barstar family protein [uncultured Agathobaculum sp.]|uniref:barstar family protein n=1 Tax=uncultured Agathobaculum sp. TaxID=2048140 RepID=UPI00296FC61C
MKELLLDADTLYTRGQAHDVLAKTFGFPADYGRNLDALYDLLTACPPTRLTLRHAEMLVANLGNYGELLLRVLADAAAENPNFTLNAC